MIIGSDDAQFFDPHVSCGLAAQIAAKPRTAAVSNALKYMQRGNPIAAGEVDADAQSSPIPDAHSLSRRRL